MRITDDMVRDWLIWARNYGEIDSFKIVSERGRKWLIKMPEGTTTTASGMEPSFLERRLVPDEMVLTNREAIVFGMGLALAGGRSKTRSEVARSEWGWGEEEAPAETTQDLRTHVGGGIYAKPLGHTPSDER